MKNLLLSISILISGVPSFAQELHQDSAWLFSYFKGNGEDGLHLACSLDGYKWSSLKHDSSFLQPSVSNDKLMRDPCIIAGPDGNFHMVWTVSWKDKGIGYATSPDLINWSEQQYLPVMEYEATTKNAWAPEIIYDDINKQYMIFWASTIPGRFPETDSLGDNNHRIYYVTTNDFKTFSKTSILYDHGFNVIDATIFKEGEQYVMILKDETLKPLAKKNLRLAFSKNLTYGFGEASSPITRDYWAEGPTVLKTGNRYIVYFDKYTLGKYGAITSTDLKEWTDISDEISLPPGIRHGSVFKVSLKQLEKLRN